MIDNWNNLRRLWLVFSVALAGFAQTIVTRGDEPQRESDVRSRGGYEIIWQRTLGGPKFDSFESIVSHFQWRCHRGRCAPHCGNNSIQSRKEIRMAVAPASRRDGSLEQTDRCAWIRPAEEWRLVGCSCPCRALGRRRLPGRW